MSRLQSGFKNPGCSWQETTHVEQVIGDLPILLGHTEAIERSWGQTSHAQNIKAQ